MGKIEAESIINHFSHQHPLKLISFQSSNPNRTKCSLCTKEASGLIYICELCSYVLHHKPCFNMPRYLTHRSDRNHILTLLPSPVYKEGSFQCNACGMLGRGFCYHCEECQIDLHTVCAFMRESVKGSAHDHPLELCFEPPYKNKAFVCNVCGGSGSNHWLYRCDSCGFDSHLKCAKKPIVQESGSRIQKITMDQKSQTSPRIRKIQQHDHMVKSKNVHFPTSSSSHTIQCFPPVFQQPQVGISCIPEQYPFVLDQSLHRLHRYGTVSAYTSEGPNRSDRVQNVVQSAIEGLVEGAFSQLGQTLLQGALGN